MSKKKLQEYLSNIKKQNKHDHHHHHRFPKMDSFTFSINHKKLSKIFSGCKHPHKTLSFSIEPTYTLPRHLKKKEPPPDETERGGEATLSDIERFLVENFKSLYGNKYEDDQNEDEVDDHQSHTYDDIETDQVHQDFCGSNAPTTMEDGVGSASDSTNYEPLMCISEKDATVSDECIVVMKRSSTPYDDFWSSMKDMIEGRVENGGLADGEFLQEMLLCFLNLNEKKYYRFIVSAFMNLTADLWHK